MKKSCEHCGCYFERIYNAQRFCCVECREAGTKERRPEYSRRFREKRKAMKKSGTKKPETLIDIAVEARNAGMSYGQYVAKMKL